MKRIATILTLILVLALSAQAQIFLQDGDENKSRDVTVPVNDWPVNPGNYSQGNDDYVPTGSGIVLLITLGGAYLMNMRKKDLRHTEE